MKSLRFILPLAALATAAVTVAQSDKKDPFAVAPDRVEKIKAAMPKKTPAPVKRKHEVLVFTKTAGFRHGSIPSGVESMKQLGAATGLFNVTHSEDAEVFKADSLAKFDAVIFLNSTGSIFKDAPSGEDTLKKNLLDFVQGGKGVVGFHSAGDTYNDWDGWAQMLGTGFESHPWNAGDTVRVKNLDPKHPLTASFNGEGLTIKDEIYKFKPGRAQPGERRMLLSLDFEGTDMKKDDKDKDGKPEREFYPIAWLNSFGKGRSFYCSLGHNDEVYWNPVVVEHYLAGIQYALGELEADDAPRPVALRMKDGKLVASN